MHERHDALERLSAVIGRAADPSQSLRVARALRRVVVRDLDQRVSGALKLADQGPHDTRSARGELRAGVCPGNLVVLAESLAVLRPDVRSRRLALRARRVAQRCESA